MKKLFIISNWMQGKALSGGDRIFIELSKRWSQKLEISIFLSKEGAHICRREGLNVTNQSIWASDIFSGHYLIDGIYRTITGILKVLRMRTHQIPNYLTCLLDHWTLLWKGWGKELLLVSHQHLRVFLSHSPRIWFDCRSSESYPLVVIGCSSYSFFQREFRDQLCRRLIWDLRRISRSLLLCFLVGLIFLGGFLLFWGYLLRILDLLWIPFNSS